MSDLAKAALEDSLLFKKQFPSRGSLLSHLAGYLEDEDSKIGVVQFQGHTPTIEAVAEDLRLFSWIPAFEQGTKFLKRHPLRLLAAHEHDWFLEFLGATAAVLSIYDFIAKRLEGRFPTRTQAVTESVPATRTRYRTVTKQVPVQKGGGMFLQAVSQQVPYQEEYVTKVKRTKEVEVRSVGRVQITEFDEVVRRIRRYEIYDATGNVKAADFPEPKK